MAEVNLSRFTKILEEPAYVAVGFGVLGFQRAQVWRRDVERRLARRAGSRMGARLGDDINQRLSPLRQAVSDVAADAGGRFGPLVNDASQRIGPVVADAAAKLPPEAKDLADALGDLAVDLTGEARELAKEVAAFGRLALQVVRAPTSRPNYP